MGTDRPSGLKQFAAAMRTADAYRQAGDTDGCTAWQSVADAYKAGVPVSDAVRLEVARAAMRSAALLDAPTDVAH